MNPLTRKATLVILLLASSFTLLGFGCRRPQSPVGGGQSLVVWGLWQDSTMVDPVFKAFTEQTGIAVEYRKIASVATYEQDLLKALAEGRGPDVFVIHHTWIEGKRGIMAPAPAEIATTKAINDEFVDVVAEDLIRDGSIYALPTSVDTLSLFYNKDMFNAAGIARPPRTWQEIQQAVQKLTTISRLGDIQQSGIAIGTAANVNRAPDILQLLMMQSGMVIVDERTGSLQIANETGQRALTFYTDFANRSKQVYSWNLQEDYSIDAFAEGEAAMMLNYSYHVPTITAKNPRLNFAVAPAPQIADSPTPITFANYWPFAVAVSSRYPVSAWQLVRFMTGQQQALAINQAQAAPPARRDNIAAQSQDPILGTFAEQSLTASTWPRVDIVATDAIFNTMIDEVVTGAATIPDALRRAEDQLRNLTRGE